jgi:hypothetical protein
MSPTEIPVTEIVQINTAVQIGLAIGGGVLSPATVAQFVNQSNIL